MFRKYGQQLISGIFRCFGKSKLGESISESIKFPLDTMVRSDLITREFPAEDAVGLLRSQGRHIVEAAGCWWYNAYGQKSVYYSFPPNRIVSPSSADIKEVFRKAPDARVLRYLGHARERGSESYIWKCERPYSFATIKSKARNQVRQGLRMCEVRKLALRELEAIGEKAHADSLKRFGIAAGRLRFGKVMHDSPSYEAWGAFVGDDLAAFLVTLRIEDWVYIQIHRSVTECLKYRPNNALIYTVMEELLSRPGVSTVSYGWEPLYALDSLDDFKSAMGSIKQPCRQVVVLSPALRMAFRPVVCRAIERLAAFRQSNRRLRQMAGVCRLIRESAG